MKETTYLKNTIHCGYALDQGIRPRQADSLGYVEIPFNAETAILHQKKGHLYVLADGVGEAAEGHLASALAVETIITHYYDFADLDIPTALQKAIQTANQHLVEAGEKMQYNQHQTTIVCAVIHQHTLYIAHLGDSRAHLVRGGEIIYQTKDHVATTRLFMSNSNSKSNPSSSQRRAEINRFLGTRAPLEIEISQHPLQVGDSIILTSDGIHDYLEPAQFTAVMQTPLHPNAACAALLTQAKQNESGDNLSIIITQLQEQKSVTLTLPTSNRYQRSNIFPFMQTALATSFSPPQPSIWANLTKLLPISLIVAVLLLVILIAQIIYSQNNQNQLQTELQQTEQILSDLKQDLTILRKAYQQEDNAQLEQTLNRMEEQLQQIIQTPSVTETPFIIVPATSNPNNNGE